MLVEKQEHLQTDDKMIKKPTKQRKSSRQGHKKQQIQCETTDHRKKTQHISKKNKHTDKRQLSQFTGY